MAYDDECYVQNYWKNANIYESTCLFFRDLLIVGRNPAVTTGSAVCVSFHILDIVALHTDILEPKNYLLLCGTYVSVWCVCVCACMWEGERKEEEEREETKMGRKKKEPYGERRGEGRGWAGGRGGCTERIICNKNLQKINLCAVTW